ncbi:MAG: cytidylate kinase-like family protein [Lachnospiraceae bacterium]|nr:cytidylate kinase-like family protein [Lachnospiraceae bacterium]
MNNHLVITVGREFGSGGHEIAEKLAKKMEVNCYDKEILAESAKKSGFSEKLFEKNDETAKNSLIYSIVTGIGNYSNSRPLSVQLYLEQFYTIKEIADRESCVMVGRCSDYVLRETDYTVNIFAHAPLDARIRRICQRYQVDDKKAQDMIEKQDKMRASYYNYYTNQKWGRSKHYDLTFDTSKIGVEGAVQLVMEYLDIRS